MRSRFFLIFLIILSIDFFTNCSFAQETIEYHADNKFFFKNPRKKSVSVNFELINNLIVIPVVINDSDTLHFILDSGFNSIMISDMGYNMSISLHQTRRVQLIGLGEGEPVQALRSQGNDLYIAGIVGTNQEVFVLVEDIFHLSSKMGKIINGILGHGFFRDFIIEINYDRKILTFHDPDRYRYRRPRRNTQELPIIVQQNKSYLQTMLVLEDKSTIPALLVIDTGGSHSLWLDGHSNQHIPIPEKSISTLLGTGLNGPIYGKVGRINQLRIGSSALEHVIASYPDSLSISYAIGADNRQGSLGAEILRRFNVIFDYPNRKITLRPNLQFRQSFYYNTSGIEISNPVPGLPYFVVSDIRAGSNAAKAGLKLEDELVLLQGNSVSKLKLTDIHYMLQGKPGKTIKMIIKRDGVRIPIEFKLEEII